MSRLAYTVTISRLLVSSTLPKDPTIPKTQRDTDEDDQAGEFATPGRQTWDSRVSSRQQFGKEFGSGQGGNYTEVAQRKTAGALLFDSLENPKTPLSLKPHGTRVTEWLRRE